MYLRMFAVFLVGLSVQAADYGVDCSFPIHSTDFRCGDLLGDRKSFYEEFMQGCRDSLGPKKARSCDVTEQDRLQMSLLQPQSMVVRLILHTIVLIVVTNRLHLAELHIDWLQEDQGSQGSHGSALRPLGSQQG